MIANIVSMTLLEKVGVKVSFELDKIIMTKNNIFVMKDYYNQRDFEESPWDHIHWLQPLPEEKANDYPARRPFKGTSKAVVPLN